MMRVAILADTHGRLDPRIEALVRGCDIAVHGGDIGNAGILARLQPRSGQVYAVRGNNDVARKWPDGEQVVLEQLPERAEVELPGGTLVVVHGHQSAKACGRHARLRREHPSARAIVYGHSHRLVVDRDALPWVLNPGAAGRARTYGGPSCMILGATATDWQVTSHRFEVADPPRVRQRIGADASLDRDDPTRGGNARRSRGAAQPGR